MNEPMRLLNETEIGDNLDLDTEGTYKRSDGSSVMTVSVDKLLSVQLALDQKHENTALAEAKKHEQERVEGIRQWLKDFEDLEIEPFKQKYGANCLVGGLLANFDRWQALKKRRKNEPSSN